MRKHYLALAAGALILAMCTGVYARPPMLYGEITAIDDTAMTLVVKGTDGVSTTVHTTDSTTVLVCGVLASFDDLEVGQFVHVVGTIVDGQFIAARICVQVNQNGHFPF
jgi:hypothetical protein